AALLLSRSIPAKGLLTTLMMLPMMLCMAVVGLFWQLLYNPSWGIVNYLLGLEGMEWLSNPDVALYAIAITDIWMVTVRDAALPGRTLGDSVFSLRSCRHRPRVGVVCIHPHHPAAGC